MFPESKCLHQFGETIISLTDSKKRKYSAVFLDSSDCRSILMADIPDKSEKNNKARVWATRTVPLLKPAITDLLANVKPSCKNIWSPLKVETANLWRVAKLAFASTFLIAADIQLFSWWNVHQPQCSVCLFVWCWGAGTQLFWAFSIKTAACYTVSHHWWERREQRKIEKMQADATKTVSWKTLKGS